MTSSYNIVGNRIINLGEGNKIIDLGIGNLYLGEVFLPREYAKDLVDSFRLFSDPKISDVLPSYNKDGSYEHEDGVNLNGICELRYDNGKIGLVDASGRVYKDIEKYNDGFNFYRYISQIGLRTGLAGGEAGEVSKNEKKGFWERHKTLKKVGGVVGVGLIGAGIVFGAGLIKEQDGKHQSNNTSLSAKYFHGRSELFKYKPEDLKVTNVTDITFPSLKQLESSNKEILYEEKLSYKDLYEKMNNSDIIVFGEYHGFNLEKFYGVADFLELTEKNTSADIIGMEGWEHDEPIDSSFPSYVSLINFAKNNSIPIVGIEPEEKNPEVWHGGKPRFRGLNYWMLNQTEEDKKPIVYIGDGHTSDLGVGKNKESWRYESPYNIKDAYLEHGYKPLILHIRDKPRLAKLTDKYLKKDYEKIEESQRQEFLNEADSLWSSIVKPWETENYFIKINEEEYYFIISDHELPCNTPKESVWIHYFS